MNDYFVNITQSLNIPKYLPQEKNYTPPNSNAQAESYNSTLDKIIQAYEPYPSIIAIKGQINHQTLFSFEPVSIQTIAKEIDSLDSKKATGPDGILSKVIKASAEELSETLQILTTLSKLVNFPMQ